MLIEVFYKEIYCQLAYSLYIDNLVISLKEVSFEILAYADDLAFICKNKHELDKVIELLENWATTNEIAVNKKKSAILVVDNDRNNMQQYKGYLPYYLYF